VAINRAVQIWCLAAACAALPSVVRAQAPSVEIDLTGGYSGEHVRAAAGQIRAFVDLGSRSGIQYFGELAWGQRWSGDRGVVGGTLIGMDPLGSDVFGAAYPYGHRAQVTEAFGERTFKRRGALLSVRAGQFRTPFGIYNRSDYGYTGFIRPPLIRYDGYFALSNNYLERGAMITAGVPQLLVDASIGKPHDVGSSHRREGVDESVRVQAYGGPLIVGVSHARSEPYMPAVFAFGRQSFTGIDARWTDRRGVQLRGEFLHGHSFDGVTTDGWYLDAALHRVRMGPVTTVARVESMAYTAPAPRARSERRLTLGARIRLPGYVTVQINYMHQHGDLPRLADDSLDVTFTYSIRYR
jgi:hypothetical protein